MTVVNTKDAPRAKVQAGDKIIQQHGALVLVRDMHLSRRHAGKQHYDMGYWAVAPKDEEEVT